MASAQSAGQVASRDFETRLKAMFEIAIPKLAPDVGQQLKQMISPESIAIMAGVLVAWIISHGAGIGEIIDAIILVAGVFAIGMAVFSGLDYLYNAVSLTYKASTKKDLEKAADDFAKGISILGVQIVLAILFKKIPKTGRGSKINIGDPPPKNSLIRYKPKTVKTSNLYAGEGETSFWGDVELSTRGSNEDRELVRLHERVHQILAPKLYFLRNFRVQARGKSYFHSSLWRYFEEALCETVAQVGVRGFKKFFVGIKFPLVKDNEYAYLTCGGGFATKMTGHGVVPEGAALISSGMIMGISFNLWVKKDSKVHHLKLAK